MNGVLRERFTASSSSGLEKVKIDTTDRRLDVALGNDLGLTDALGV
jgi:hypothetical protein